MLGVQVVTCDSQKEAVEVRQELQVHNIDSFVLPKEEKEKVLLRVMAGSFKDPEAAKEQQNKLSTIGFNSSIVALQEGIL